MSDVVIISGDSAGLGLGCYLWLVLIDSFCLADSSLVPL